MAACCSKACGAVPGGKSTRLQLAGFAAACSHTLVGDVSKSATFRNRVIDISAIQQRQPGLSRAPNIETWRGTLELNKELGDWPHSHVAHRLHRQFGQVQRGLRPDQLPAPGQHAEPILFRRRQFQHAGGFPQPVGWPLPFCRPTASPPNSTPAPTSSSSTRSCGSHTIPKRSTCCSMVSTGTRSRSTAIPACSGCVPAATGPRPVHLGSQGGAFSPGPFGPSLLPPAQPAGQTSPNPSTSPARPTPSRSPEASSTS